MSENEYYVWSTYKVTGTAIIRARSAAEAIERALDITADDRPEFIFGEPWGETKMRAQRVTTAEPTPDAPPHPASRESEQAAAGAGSS